MHFIFYLFLIAVSVQFSASIKVNVGGTLSLGKEVLASLSGYIGQTNEITRRSMTMTGTEENSIIEIVRNAALCRDFPFCLPYRKFVDEYVMVLARSIQAVLNAMLGEYFKPLIFDEQLKHYVEIIRIILRSTNDKINEKKEVFFWLSTIKKICAKFQEMGSIFVAEELKIKPQEINRVKKELNHKLIIASVLVEQKYINKFCVEYNICIKSFEVTEALKALLEECKKLSDERVRTLIKYFYEGLFESGFYSYVNQVTAHELQVVLNDMAYSSEINTKEILTAVEEIVENRLETIKTNKDERLSHDALLINGILSDIDHVYSLHKAEPFAAFFQDFFEWKKLHISKIKIDKEVRLVMKDIGKKLLMVSDDLLIKIMNEVKVFLELTVDPEK